MEVDQDANLSEAEVRAVVRLLADALVPDDGRVAKARRAMDGLCDLVEADAWLWFRSRVEGVGLTPVNIDFLYGRGFGNDQMATIADRGFEVRGEPPEYPELKRLIMIGRPFTRARRELVGDEVWQQPVHRRHVRRMRLDEHVYSIVPMDDPDGPGKIASVLMLFRSEEKPGFSVRDVRLVHLLFEELGPLHVDALDFDAAEVHQGLTPRQRSVLIGLVDGSSSAEIAESMRLSPHTVNDSVKAIYRHFDVQSRGELMNRFRSRQTGTQA